MGRLKERSEVMPVAFYEGYKAFKTGNLGNPYNPDTKAHRDFEYGFNQAYFANKESSGDNERKIYKKSETITGSYHSEARRRG